MASNKVRFAVGSPKEYRSAVWTLSVHKNEVYLGARHLMGWIKLSMHASGIWRLAWTQESRIKAQGSADRVEMRWKRPKEFHAGWTQGPAVIVPTIPLKCPFEHDSNQDLGNVVWIPTFSPWHQHHFTVLFVGKSASLDSWNRAVRSSDRKVGILSLRNGDNVVVCQRERAMVQKEKSGVLSMVKDMRIEWEKIPEVVTASLFSPGTDDAGHPYILDIPLAWENVFEKKRV